MDKLLLIGLTLILSACGGGGGGAAEPGYTWEDDPPGFVSINPPDQDLYGYRDEFTRTASGSYETELRSTIFNGGVSFVSSAECNGHPGFDVTVTNETTGETVNASERVTCDLIFRSGKWQSGRIALQLGNNRITASGAGDTSSITVVRVANPPRVTSVYPEKGSMDVSVSIYQVEARFSENLASSSVDTTSFFLQDSTGAIVPAIVGSRYADQSLNSPSKILLRPDEPLKFATTYTATITTAIMDGHGNALAEEYSWSFTTVADILPPNLIEALPAAGTACAAPDSDISVQFDKMIDPASLTNSTFILEDSTGTPVNGQVSGFPGAINYFARFTPESPLDPAESYTVHLKPGITDLAGNGLEPSSWSFDTPYLAEGSWTPFAVPQEVTYRRGHSTVWTGVEILVWGGYKGDSYAYEHRRYDPVLDQWSWLSSGGAPSVRQNHSATWTGAEMIVWGGRGESTASGLEYLNDGGRYDPVTNSWTPMSTIDAPTARNRHTAIWTGTELIVWGGLDQNDRTFTGGRYDPSMDTWTPMSTINAPAARYGHHAVFDGQRMIIWGGRAILGGLDVQVSDGAVYDPVSDVWTPLPAQNAPDITKPALMPDSVVFAGNDLLVWSPWTATLSNPVSARFPNAVSSEARRYDTVQEQWVSVVDACDATATPKAVWLDGRMLSWNDDLTEGYAYDEQRDIWHPITAYPGWHFSESTVIAIGDAVIAWGYEYSSTGGYRLTF